MVYETANALAKKLTDDELRGLRTMPFREQLRREKEALAVTHAVRVKARLAEVAPYLCNFLLGVAHAMACRMALRWLNGHRPVGTTPNGGGCWTAEEGAELQYRVAQELPPRVRDQENQSTYLTTNPLRWKTEAEIRSGLSRPFIHKKYERYRGLPSAARSYAYSF